MGQYMARRLMDLARTHFMVRTCQIPIDGSLPRPCLYYHMKACLGPCVAELTTAEEYAAAVEDVRLFLSGRHRELLPRLETSMWAASEREDFERAARVRDLISVVRRLDERQDVELPGRGDADVFAVAGDGENATVCVLPYRDGKLVDKREFHFEGVGDVAAGELLVSFAAQYYEANPAVPRRSSRPQLSLDEEDRHLLATYLGHLRGRVVRVGSPQRGPRARRVALALDNARAAFELRFRAALSQAQHLERRLGEALGLAGPVRRFECFDISHSSGKDTTASCVVWAERPDGPAPVPHLQHPRRGRDRRLRVDRRGGDSPLPPTPRRGPGAARPGADRRWCRPAQRRHGGARRVSVSSFRSRPSPSARS